MKRKRDMIDFTGDIIHVKCDGSDKLTHVHRSLLEKWTNVFEISELVRGTLDPINNTLDLSKLAHHDGFKFVVQWMYNQEVQIVDDATDPVAAIDLLGHAYCVAEELEIGWEQEDYSLGNCIMDQFVHRMTVPRYFGPAVTVEDFLNLCRPWAFYLGGFAHDWLMYGDLTSKVDPENIVQLISELHNGEFVDESFLYAFVEKRLAGKGSAPWDIDPCAYHRHSSDSEPCEGRMPIARLLAAGGKAVESGQAARA